MLSIAFRELNHLPKFVISILVYSLMYSNWILKCKINYIKFSISIGFEILIEMNWTGNFCKVLTIKFCKHCKVLTFLQTIKFCKFVPKFTFLKKYFKLLCRCPPDLNHILLNMFTTFSSHKHIRGKIENIWMLVHHTNLHKFG